MKAGNVMEGLLEKASLEHWARGSREDKGHTLVTAGKETSAPSSR